MLNVHALHAGYGKSQVLRGVSFDVRPGEIVALLGRNGSGRSTTAKAIMGLLAAQGSARWKDTQLLGRQPFEIARLGLGYVPETRDIFPRLTVQQNLLLGQKPGAAGRASRWQLQDIYTLFAPLAARAHAPGGALSGGEQQMLTLGRTLMGGPEMILIDEPTEGLAPQMVEQVGRFLLTLKAQGVAILLIEQKLTLALRISDRALVMGRGQVVFNGPPQTLAANASVRQEWLEV